MQAVKRVEVVVESLHESSVERLIRRSGIGGYTLVRGVAGLGDRGRRDADGLTGVSQNVCFIVAAEPEAAERLAAALRPLLKKAGGMCLVSDAGWVEH